MDNIQFEEIMEFAKTLKYTSMSYVDFEEVNAAEIVVNEKTLKLLYDKSNDVNQIHYACEDLEELTHHINMHDLRGLIKFIPYDSIQLFENQGFNIHCAYQDYYLHNTIQQNGILSMNTEIQYATVEDAETLSDVSIACSGQSRGFFGETKEWFKEWLEENQIIVKRVDGKIVGFCCVSIYAEGTTLWIRELAVHPDFQGRGIGKELLLMGLKHGLLEGANKSFLAVDIENKSAIQLYKHLGFEAKENEIEVQMLKL